MAIVSNNNKWILVAHVLMFLISTLGLAAVPTAPANATVTTTAVTTTTTTTAEDNPSGDFIRFVAKEQKLIETVVMKGNVSDNSNRSVVTMPPPVIASSGDEEKSDGRSRYSSSRYKLLQHIVTNKVLLQPNVDELPINVMVR